jgi:hypothetical protein
MSGERFHGPRQRVRFLRSALEHLLGDWLPLRKYTPRMFLDCQRYARCVRASRVHTCVHPCVGMGVGVGVGESPEWHRQCP